MGADKKIRQYAARAWAAMLPPAKRISLKGMAGGSPNRLV
jgi:hypothetical protein